MTPNSMLEDVARYLSSETGQIWRIRWPFGQFGAPEVSRSAHRAGGLCIERLVVRYNSFAGLYAKAVIPCDECIELDLHRAAELTRDLSDLEKRIADFKLLKAKEANDY